jgi:hypothetical protein
MLSSRKPVLSVLFLTVIDETQLTQNKKGVTKIESGKKQGQPMGSH